MDHVSQFLFANLNCCALNFSAKEEYLRPFWFNFGNMQKALFNCLHWHFFLSFQKGEAYKNESRQANEFAGIK